jgi:hypothetical protein
MKRAGRWSLNILACLLLAVFLASSGLWIRSYWRADVFQVRHSWSWEFDSNQGKFNVSCSIYSLGYVVNPPSGNPWIVRVGPATPASDSLQFKHFDMPVYRNTWIHRSFGLFETTSYAGAGSAIGTISKGRGVFFPAWFLVAVSLPLPVWRAVTTIKASRLRRRAASGQCLKCGYDLRATPGRCPECGAIAAVKEIISN